MTDLCAENPNQPYAPDLCAEDPDGQRIERYPDGRVLTLWRATWQNNRRQRRVTLHSAEGRLITTLEAGEQYAKRFYNAERTRLEKEQT